MRVSHHIPAWISVHAVLVPLPVSLQSTTSVGTVIALKLMFSPSPICLEGRTSQKASQ
jgi:hypothetical protein